MPRVKDLKESAILLLSKVFDTSCNTPIEADFEVAAAKSRICLAS
jgi:hypothetical protein